MFLGYEILFREIQLKRASSAILIVLAGHLVVRPAALFTPLAINLLTYLRHFGLAMTGVTACGWRCSDPWPCGSWHDIG